MNYSEKLRDPRWQKKRLEILDRDGFICRRCIATDKTLHVHHKFYIKGVEPWDYDGYVYVTLCEDCHEVEELIILQKKRLIKNLKEGGFIVHRYCPACGNPDINSFLVPRYQRTVCGLIDDYKTNDKVLSRF